MDLNQPKMDPWYGSSQHAANLYAAGHKLWRREDLLDIEEQLAQSRNRERFILRRFDGFAISILNPMFRVDRPIWKPYVVFRDYWNLVWNKPGGWPEEKYKCTYLVDYKNVSLQNFNQGSMPEAQALFDEARAKWEGGATCAAFKKRLQELLTRSGGVENPSDGETEATKTKTTARTKKVTKVICFGLGEIARKAPDWWRLNNQLKPQAERQSETQSNSRALIHHAVALTIAQVVADSQVVGDFASLSVSDPNQEQERPKEQQQQKVRLLTQDPDYSEASISILENTGEFEIVGEHGAGGFAEVDDECIVFSPFVSAPVRQIVECIARPVAMIYVDYRPDVVFVKPGTVKMMEDYEVSSFPTGSDSGELNAGLERLKIYNRMDGQSRLT